MSDPRSILSQKGPSDIVDDLEKEIASTCRASGVKSKLLAVVHVSDVGTSISWSGCDCLDCVQHAITGLAQSLGATVVLGGDVTPKKQVH